MTQHSSTTTDAVEILHQRYYAGNPQRLLALEAERANAEIGQLAYTLRTAAGLTHDDLAHKIGVEPDAIRDLEDADYEGHALALLRRIADVLGKRITLAGAGYVALIQQGQEGFRAIVPDVPECTAEGTSHEEAAQGINEALQEYIEAAQKAGKTVPAPSTTCESIPVFAE